MVDPAPARKELRDLSDSELNLLREGLAKFQNEKSADDPKSWFQIAGMYFTGLIADVRSLTFARNPWATLHDVAEPRLE